MAKAKRRKMVLDEEEREIEAGIKRGEWKRVEGQELAGLKSQLEGAARAGIEHRTKEARVNIRMSQGDVEMLKAAADREGIGYQTLMSSVIHKFVTGQLVERRVLEELVKAIGAKKAS